MVREAAAHCRRGTASSAPVPSPSRSPRSSSGVELECCEGGGVRRLGRAMPCLPPRLGPGGEPFGDQGSGAGDDAVEHDRGAALRGAGEKACHCGKVGSADDAHQSCRVVEKRPSATSGVPDRTGLADPAGVVDAGAAPDQACAARSRSAGR